MLCISRMFYNSFLLLLVNHVHMHSFIMVETFQHNPNNYNETQWSLCILSSFVFFLSFSLSVYVCSFWLVTISSSFSHLFSLCFPLSFMIAVSPVCEPYSSLCVLTAFQLPFFRFTSPRLTPLICSCFAAVLQFDEVFLIHLSVPSASEAFVLLSIHEVFAEKRVLVPSGHIWN